MQASLRDSLIACRGSVLHLMQRGLRKLGLSPRPRIPRGGCKSPCGDRGYFRLGAGSAIGLAATPCHWTIEGDRRVVIHTAPGRPGLPLRTGPSPHGGGGGQSSAYAPRH